jgi:hypothetical protein
MHESGVRVRCRSWCSGGALLLSSNGATVTSSHAGRPLFPLCPLGGPPTKYPPVLPQGTHWSQQQYSRNFRDQSSGCGSVQERRLRRACRPAQSSRKNFLPGTRNVFGAGDGFVREAGRRMLPRPLSDGWPHACPPGRRVGRRTRLPTACSCRSANFCPKAGRNLPLTRGAWQNHRHLWMMHTRGAHRTRTTWSAASR